MTKEFTIKCEMEERWINQFISFLKYMERNGKIGHSCRVGFYADGDGDFRPIFTPSIDYEVEEALINAKTDRKKEMERGYHIFNEVTFDAG